MTIGLLIGSPWSAETIFSVLNVSRLGGGDERGDQRVPAGRVRLAPGQPFRAETLPTGVDDLEPGRAVAEVDERQFDVGRVAAVAANVPEVPEAVRAGSTT